MDTISESIKCPNCHFVLSKPVLLPCKHAICQKHASTSDNQVFCGKCGESHPNKDFTVCQPLMDIIDAHIDSIDFGFVHQEAKKSFHQLKQELIIAERIINDPTYFIHEIVSDLKNKVNLKTEELKFFIDQTSDKLLSELNEYEVVCNNNVEALNSKISSNNVKQYIKEQTQDRLPEWYDSLNGVKYDEEKCKQTKTACDQSKSELLEKLESFKKTILMNEVEKKTSKVKSYCKIDIQSLFENSQSSQENSEIEQPSPKINLFENVNLESRILNESLKERLFSLNNFSQDARFELLYRGSEHGFEAHNFHRKCYDVGGTLTIIKSTEGHVFGGFTWVAWNEPLHFHNDPFSNGWKTILENAVFVNIKIRCKDPSAYLFSLANEYDQAFCLKVKGDCCAMVRDPKCGPIFGDDIWISNKPNEKSCVSSVGQSYSVEGTSFKPYQSLAKHRCFLVQELEVFKVIST